jgi:hypothetical protein
MRVANAMEGAAHANGIITVHLAPEQSLVALSLEFADELKTPCSLSRKVQAGSKMRSDVATAIWGNSKSPHRQ